MGLSRDDGVSDEIPGNFPARGTGSELAVDGTATGGCGREVEVDEGGGVPVSEEDAAEGDGGGWVMAASGGTDGGAGIAVAAVGV